MKERVLNSWSWRSLGPAADRKAQDCVALLQDLIRIDTTNPPGNEQQAAELVADTLAGAGLDPKLIETAPGRACTVARVRGDGTRAPLLLTAHLDVVAADASRWRHPPFAAEIHDGCVWGRGAVDMKNMAAMSMIILRTLAELKVPLKRDVIFAAVADEETGCEQGSFQLVDHHADLVRAEYMFGEVGGFTLHLMGRVFYPIQIAEKGVCWVKLRARGRAGHAAIPDPRSAVIQLAEAITTLGRQPLPHHGTAATRQFLEQLAAHLPFPASRMLPLLANEVVGPALLRAFVRHPAQRRWLAPLLSNTASPVRLTGGSHINILPAEATVDLDGRTLPGQNTAAFLHELRALVGDQLEMEVIREMEPVVTTPDSPAYREIARALRAHDPEAIPVPYIIPGFTDAKAFSKLGTSCYGFTPVRLRLDDGLAFSDLYHANDERIPVAGLQWGLGVLWDAVIGLCT